MMLHLRLILSRRPNPVLNVENRTYRETHAFILVIWLISILLPYSIEKGGGVCYHSIVSL